MSIVERAAAELERVNFGAEESQVMLGILRTFFDTWDSGGAVSIVAPVLQRLLAGKPLSPLTGADDEWIDRSELGDGRIVAQNIRCPTVFKLSDGSVVDMDVPITFPYMPADAAIPFPVAEF